MDFSIRRDLNSRIDYQSRNYTAKTSDREAVKTSEAKYDTVSISKNNTVPSESEFAKLLSHEISRSMKDGAPQSRVAELHDLVQSGQYHVSASRVAERMLGYRA